MICPKCGRRLPDTAKFCSRCGCIIEKDKGKGIRGKWNSYSTVRKLLTILCLLIVLIIVLGAVRGFFYSNNPFEYTNESVFDQISPDQFFSIFNNGDSDEAYVETTSESSAQANPERSSVAVTNGNGSYDMNVSREGFSVTARGD